MLCVHNIYMCGEETDLISGSSLVGKGAALHCHVLRLYPAPSSDTHRRNFKASKTFLPDILRSSLTLPDCREKKRKIVHK